MFALDLLLAKLICASTLTLFSFLGAALPVYIVTSSAAAATVSSSSAKQSSPAPWSAAWLVSPAVFITLGNAFSSGLLFGAGIFHFMPSAIKDAIEAVAVPSASSRGGEALLTITVEGLEAALVRCGCYVLLGLLLPAIVDSLLTPAATAVSGPPMHSHQHHSSHHGHSHGGLLVGDDNDGDGSLDDAGATTATTTTTKVAIGDTQIAPPTARGDVGSGGGSSVVAMALLLSVHCAIEGMMIGSEDSVVALQTALVALSVHKFFDGFVIGLAVARRERRRMGRISGVAGAAGVAGVAAATAQPSLTMPFGAAAAGNGKKPASWTQLARRYCSRTVLLWLCVTPFTTLVFAIATAKSSNSPHAISNATTGSTVGGGGGGTDSGGAGGPQSSGLKCCVQGIGAGCFAFIALELMLGELRSATAEVGLRNLHKLAVVGLGVLLVAVMERGHEHHHSH